MVVRFQRIPSIPFMILPTQPDYSVATISLTTIYRLVKNYQLADVQLKNLLADTPQPSKKLLGNLLEVARS